MHFSVTWRSQWGDRRNRDRMSSVTDWEWYFVSTSSQESNKRMTWERERKEGRRSDGRENRSKSRVWKHSSVRPMAESPAWKWWLDQRNCTSSGYSSCPVSRKYWYCETKFKCLRIKFNLFSSEIEGSSCRGASVRQINAHSASVLAHVTLVITWVQVDLFHLTGWHVLIWSHVFT